MAVNYAEAQSINGICKMRFSDDPSANAALKALMAKYQDVASVACIDPRGKVISYTSVTKVQEGAQHVCLFRLITDLRYPDLKPGPRGIETRMTMAKPDCPRQDDPRYVAANGVSEGVFAALVKFAEDFRRSEESFNSAFALSRQDSEQSRFVQMRTDLLTLSDPAGYEISGVALNSLPSERTAYSVHFSETPFCGRSWKIVVDLTADGWKATEFSQMDTRNGYHLRPDDPGCPKR